MAHLKAPRYQGDEVEVDATPEGLVFRVPERVPAGTS